MLRGPHVHFQVDTFFQEVVRGSITQSVREREGSAQKHFASRRFRKAGRPFLELHQSPFLHQQRCRPRVTKGQIQTTSRCHGPGWPRQSSQFQHSLEWLEKLYQQSNHGRRCQTTESGSPSITRRPSQRDEGNIRKVSAGTEHCRSVGLQGHSSGRRIAEFKHDIHLYNQFSFHYTHRNSKRRSHASGKVAILWTPVSSNRHQDTRAVVSGGVCRSKDGKWSLKWFGR